MPESLLVFNLATGEERYYSGITPRQAVIAAYAQSLGDYNTWDYAEKYDALVETGHFTYLLGDWSVIHTDPAQFSHKVYFQKGT